MSTSFTWKHRSLLDCWIQSRSFTYVPHTPLYGFSTAKKIQLPDEPVKMYKENPISTNCGRGRFNEKLGNRVLFVADPYRTQKRLMHSVARKKKRKFAELDPPRVFERLKVREAERNRLLDQAQQRSQGKGKPETLAQYLRAGDWGRYRVDQGDFSYCRVNLRTVPMRMCVSTVEYPAHQDSHYMVPPQELSKIHYWTDGI